MVFATLQEPRDGPRLQCSTQVERELCVGELDNLVAGTGVKIGYIDWVIEVDGLFENEDWFVRYGWIAFHCDM